MTNLHAKLAEAHAAQQAAQDRLHTAELNLQKEAATRGVLESSLERAQRELAEANEERCDFLQVIRLNNRLRRVPRSSAGFENWP